MGKRLSEMSLSELWQLFPIILTEHQECWKDWYREEESQLKRILPPEVRIAHIGSTAIASIWAKPIIDILVGVPVNTRPEDYKNAIVTGGYICMHHGENGISFNKGYTENGFAERVYHLHLRHMNHDGELYFRDYLLEHPDVAKAYEKLKLALWKEYEHDRDAYTNAKAEFVRKYTARAKLLYGQRY
ncbi:MAG: GrpB family protein [Clostridia bacterium]|nr:GrpB family protein [Clostridia bacterium]